MTTILIDDRTLDVDAVVRAGTLLLTSTTLRDVCGWELKAEGLCRDDVCVPTRSRPDVEVDGLVDLGVVADVLGRPLVFDDDASVAALGESAATRAAQLADARVDDLALRDLDGGTFVWASIGGKKKVLVAWASW